MRTDLYGRLGYGDSPSADVIARLDRFINESQRELVTMRGLARLRRATLPFTSTSGSPFCVLPQAAVRIAGIQDPTTQKSLRERSIQEIRYGDPGLTRIDSSPDEYALINLSAAVTVDVFNTSTGTAVLFQSTSAADVQVGHVAGVTLGGFPRQEAITLLGTSQAVSTYSDWAFIQKVWLDTPAAGDVTLLQTHTPLTGPVTYTEMSRITAGHYSCRYTRILLHGTPSQAVTYNADVDLHIDDLVTAGDSPYLPEDFHWLLVCGACKKEAVKRRDWDAFRAEDYRWKDGTAGLKAFCRQRTDDGHTGFPSQFSQLGPWYRAGS